MSPLRWSEVVDAARRVVEGYEHAVTLRQVFYRLAAAGTLPLTTTAYKKLSAHLAEQRRRGAFPDLLDSGRRVHIDPTFSEPGELLASVPGWYRRDRTAGQDTALYVAVEKDTLRLQVLDWLDEFGVPVLVVRGYGSQSYADVVTRRVATDPRPAVLLYLGDLDASGEDIERDWVARTGCWTHVHRLAITIEQAAGLPAADGKASDPRWTGFARRHDLDPTRPVQWEVEAIDPTTLRGLLLDAVAGYVDADQLAAVIAEERAQRARLSAFLRTWHL